MKSAALVLLFLVCLVAAVESQSAWEVWTQGLFDRLRQPCCKTKRCRAGSTCITFAGNRCRCRNKFVTMYSAGGGNTFMRTIEDKQEQIVKSVDPIKLVDLRKEIGIEPMLQR